MYKGPPPVNEGYFLQICLRNLLSEEVGCRNNGTSVGMLSRSICSRLWMNRPLCSCIGDCMGASLPSGSMVVYRPLCLLIASLCLLTLEATVPIVDTDRVSSSDPSSSTGSSGSRRLDLRDGPLLAVRLDFSSGVLSGGLKCPRRISSFSSKVKSSRSCLM